VVEEVVGMVVESDGNFVVDDNNIFGLTGLNKIRLAI